MGKTVTPTLDLDLLVETLNQQSYSEKDQEMMKWLKDKIESLGLGYVEDTYGNLYVTKGKSDLYPCMVSHTDTVHKILKDFSVYECGDLLFAFSETEMEQVGIGGDDKVGVSLCLNALKDLDVVKVAFFRNEEIGCLGSKKASMEFFDNCTVVLQADRRGNNDFINVAAGTELSSPEFILAITPALNSHEYSVARGSITDVMTLKQRGLKVCAANMSCGYWAPHTSKETVSMSEVADCYYLMLDIFAICKHKKFEHFYEPALPKASTYEKTKSTGAPWNEGGRRMSEVGLEDLKDYRQLAIEFQKEGEKVMKHNTTPLVDLDEDDESPEEFLEEIDICINDLESVMGDWKRVRMKMLAKLGKI